MNDIPSYVLECERACEANTVAGNGLREHMSNMEKSIVLEAFNLKHGNTTDTAELLGISKQLLKYKLDSYKEQEDEA